MEQLWTPLDRNLRQIRLLRVEAELGGQVGSDEGTLVAGLETCELTSEITFNALTYVWGEDKDKDIFCSGSKLKISSNCFNALSHLRRRLGAYTIWVDAICINQTDLEEKAWQIAYMNEIYSKATVVYVWLGVSDEFTDRAMRFVQTSGLIHDYLNCVEGACSYISLLFDMNTWKLFWQLFRKRWVHDNQMPEDPDSKRTNLSRYHAITRKRGKRIWYQNHSRSSVCFASMEDFRSLLSRDWIERIWTYQEIVLSSNPVVLCGDQAVSWNQFALHVAVLECLNAGEAGNIGRIALLFTTWRKVSITRNQLREVQPLRGAPGVSFRDPNNKLREQLVRLRQILYIYMSLRLIAKWSLLTATAGTIISSAFAAFCASRPFTEVRCHSSHIHWYTSVLTLCGIITASLLVCLFFGYPTSFPPIDRESLTDMKGHIEQDHSDDIVDAVCQRKSGQAKDEAFAMRAVLSQIAGKELPAPDYNAPTPEVFRELTIILFTSTKSLQPLLAAAIHSIEGAPSWIADWSNNFSAYWLRPPLMYQRLRSVTPGSHFFFHHENKMPNTVIVRGRRICTVRECVQLHAVSSSYVDAERADHIHNLDVLRKAVSLDWSSNIWSILAKMVLVWARLTLVPFHSELRDLICNPGNHPGLPEDIDLDVLTGYWKLLCAYSWLRTRTATDKILERLRRTKMVFMSPTLHSNRSRGRLSTNLYFIAHSMPMLLRAHIAVCNGIQGSGKQFFSTEDMVPTCTSVSHSSKRQACQCFLSPRTARTQRSNSNGWGICKTNVEAGDIVVLVAGIHVPLVLRKQDDNYRLISPTVISGIMQGQAWPYRSNDLEEEAFEYFKIV